MTRHEIARSFPSSFARSHFPTKSVLWVSLFVTVYLASRLYAATHIPIFIDEAIHVDWARSTAESTPAPAGFDGKWLSIKLFSLATALPIPVDDLISARLATVSIGITTALALFLLAQDLFSTRAGLLSVALYVALPFTVIYSSTALADGIQLAFSAWSSFLAVRLARSGHWSYSVTLPLVLAASILAKFSAIVMLPLPVLAIFLLTPRTQWPRAFLRAAPALLIPLGLLVLFYRRGMLQIVETKVITGRVGLQAKMWANLLLAGTWLWGLLTPSIALLTVVGLAWLLVRERTRAGLFVVALLILLVLPYIAICEIWFPRYLLAAVIPVVLAVSQFSVGAITMIQRQWHNRRASVTAIVALGMVGLLSWPILRSGVVLLALPQAEIPEIERYQFVTGWPSGYGVEELVAFLQAQSSVTSQTITVARLHWWDHPLQSLNIYLTPSSTLSLYILDYQEAGSVAALARLSTERRTLLVLSTEHGEPQRLPAEVGPLLKCSTAIWSYTRPGGLTGLVVRELACGKSPAALGTQ